MAAGPPHILAPPPSPSSHSSLLLVPGTYSAAAILNLATSLPRSSFALSLPPKSPFFFPAAIPRGKKGPAHIFFAILLSLHRLSVLIYSFLSKLAFLLGFFGSLLSRLRRFLSLVSATGPIHPPTHHHSPRNNPRTISSDRVLLTPAPIDRNLRNLEVK